MKEAVTVKWDRLLFVPASHTITRFYTITHSVSEYLQHRDKTNLYMCLLWTATLSDGKKKANTVVTELLLPVFMCLLKVRHIHSGNPHESEIREEY